jgi:hypothetical protein
VYLLSLIDYCEWIERLWFLIKLVKKMLFQETIKDQVANMYLWPKTLEVQIIDPTKYAYAFFINKCIWLQYTFN